MHGHAKSSGALLPTSQESDRMNVLVGMIRNSLTELELGISGGSLAEKMFWLDASRDSCIILRRSEHHRRDGSSLDVPAEQPCE